MNKKFLFKIFSVLAISYVILLLLMSILNGGFILRSSELFLLPAAVYFIKIKFIFL